MTPFLALARTELRLVIRNRTTAFTALVLPIALGLFWLLTFDASTPQDWAIVSALQLAVALAMPVYITATNTTVARRQNLVLKRFRGSEITDPALLGAIAAPAVGYGLAQVVIFAVMDAIAGAPVPADPGVLVLAVLGGLALCLTAAAATSIITSSTERAQITAMPFMFAMLGGAVALPLLDSELLRQALVAIPGLSIGLLSDLAFTGRSWAGTLGGFPAVLPALAALVIWPAVFTVVARRWFRWQPRT